VFGDGVALRYIAPGSPVLQKHQLLIQYEDGSAFAASVRMYGGLWCFRNGEFKNSYYEIARDKVSPLQNGFTQSYFAKLTEGAEKLSLKAFLATEQRIPGLGNGVLQEILFAAGIHPKRKVKTLRDMELAGLFNAIKSVLNQMTAQGGRDTESDLFGQPGGYCTVMSKNNAGCPCPTCGTIIRKEAYMGGSVYYCPSCQIL